MGAGKLLVLEGSCDGIGKTTQYNKLKERLENYRHEFNFVGLSKGFTNIRDKKDKELLRQNIFYYFIMCAILFFSGAKLYWFSNNYQTLQLTNLIGLSIASIIVLFVLLYFFRSSSEIFSSKIIFLKSSS